SSGASEQLKELAEAMQIPVVCTLTAKGAFAATHPLCLGAVGMHGSRYANRAINESDLIIAVGARFSDRVTGKLTDFAPAARVIHIDIDPAEIGKNRCANVPIVGDAKGVLAGISAAVRKLDAQPRTHDWLIQIEAWRAAHPFCHPGLPLDGEVIAPEGALDLLSDLLDPTTSIVVTDVGQHQMWAAQHIDREVPRTFLSSGGAGTMGFGLP
ncbi:MAG: thiamine pyrophosphate-dependent enzyme, partial [Raoultibacter sp.]